MNLLSEPVGVAHFMIVGAVMFVSGAVCMATKRNALGVLMGIELVLNGANLNFVAFASDFLRADSRFALGLDGHIIAIFVIVLAGLGGYLALRDLVTVGMIATFISYAQNFIQPLRQLAVRQLLAALAEHLEHPEPQGVSERLELVGAADGERTGGGGHGLYIGICSEGCNPEAAPGSSRTTVRRPRTRLPGVSGEGSSAKLRRTASALSAPVTT